MHAGRVPWIVASLLLADVPKSSIFLENNIRVSIRSRDRTRAEDTIYLIMVLDFLCSLLVGLEATCS